VPTVQDVLDAIESIAPARYAFSFDRIGLQVGDPAAQVRKVAVSLDPCAGAVEFAVQQGVEMLVSHHPAIWDPLPSLKTDNYKGRILRDLVSNDISFAAAHTNWDCARGGINDELASLLGLQNVRAVGSASDKDQFKFVVTAPRNDAEKVIDAMAGEGAGVIGLYERCAFAVDGTGTFRALPGADPSVGEVGVVEHVEETRIEMVCPGDRVDSVISAMRRAHSYEEPAFDVFPVKVSGGQQITRIGELESPVSREQLRTLLDERLQTRSLVCGPDRPIRTVAVCGGAAAEEWRTVKEADAFVTGEVPHHLMVEASESEMVIAAAGHFATEHPGAVKLGEEIASRVAVEVFAFTPEPGSHGRPL
jgi:dinuclear metal center YbgI/SA1388 family protein